jgi:hypothetical protein
MAWQWGSGTSRRQRPTLFYRIQLDHSLRMRCRQNGKDVWLSDDADHSLAQSPPVVHGYPLCTTSISAKYCDTSKYAIPNIWNNGTCVGTESVNLVSFGRRMKERAGLSGGQYEFRSVPGQGTRICVRWPALEGLKHEWTAKIQALFQTMGKLPVSDREMPDRYSACLACMTRLRSQ